MMKIRCAICVLAALAFAGGAAAESAKPNFLLIVADDLNWRDLGFTGNQDVHTPNLDRLCREGMYLRHMFDPATTCSPTRHALYTGLHCIRSGAYPNHTRAYDGTKSMFTYFQDIGYRVGLQAKTHVGPPDSFPFEYISANADDFDAFARFVNRDRAQPWLAVFASHDPHGPWTRGPQDLYDPAKIAIPPYLHDNAETRKERAAYYAEITQLDTQVGALLKVLDDGEQVQNTLVMFVSEQGSSFPYGGKWLVYDNGIRTATIVRWPGKVEPGSSSDALLQYIDVPPTFLAAAGQDPTKIDTGCPDAHGLSRLRRPEFSRCVAAASPTTCAITFSRNTRPWGLLATRSRIRCERCETPATNTSVISRRRIPTPSAVSTRENHSTRGKRTPKMTRNWRLASNGSTSDLARSFTICTRTNTKSTTWPPIRRLPKSKRA